MDDSEDTALHDALATELRLAQTAAKFSAPKLEELTGIARDTIRRIIKGERPVTVVELTKFGRALGFDVSEMIAGARERALAELGRQTPEQSGRLREKLTLLATSAGKNPDALYLDVVNHMSMHGFHFPKKAWQDLITGEGTARREVLFAIAGALDVDPLYLTSDDLEVDQEVEGRLRFHRAMVDLGVEEVAARSLGPIDAAELDALQESIARAIEERKRTT